MAGIRISGALGTKVAQDAIEAQQARDEAIAARDALLNVFLGAHPSDPAYDSAGNPPSAGDLYYNTTTGSLMVFDGVGWVGYNPTVSAPHTHDLASSDIVGSLPVSKGGTGATSVAGALSVFGINKVVALSGVGTVQIDLSGGDFFKASLTGNTTFTFVNPMTVDTFVLQLSNGGNYTVTWPATVRWSTGSAPALTASGMDVLVFYTIDGGTSWIGARTMEAVA